MHVNLYVNVEGGGVGAGDRNGVIVQYRKQISIIGFELEFIFITGVCFDKE